MNDPNLLGIAQDLIEWTSAALRDSGGRLTADARRLEGLDTASALFTVDEQTPVLVTVSGPKELTLVLGTTGEEDFLDTAPRVFFERTLLPTLRAMLAGRAGERWEKWGLAKRRVFRFDDEPPAGLRAQY